MTKKIIIHTNGKPASLKIEANLRQTMQQYDLEIVPETIQPDYIITIGGDGTLLAAFHEYQAWIDEVRFVGIHTGHLGFYTDWQSYELLELVTGLIQDNEDYVTYPLLEVVLELIDGNKQTMLAVNEFSMRTLAGTMEADIYIKRYFFETFRGDGLCIATPTGSTGLSKSLGGAVMHPRLDALQLTEMAALNNRVYRTLGAPMVIPRDEYFVIHPHCQHDIVMMVDHLVCPYQAVKSVRLQIAPQRIRFAKLRHTHFWDRVENSFLGVNTKTRYLKELLEYE